ncbi:Histone-lysine N-methyltransferase ehmt1, variant 2 [Chamberlinius hualienensis]
MNGPTISELNGESNKTPSSQKQIETMARKTTTANASTSAKKSSKLISDSLSNSAIGNSVLGSMMKNDLGEILRRSCRERKSNTRFVDDGSSNLNKPTSPKELSEKRRSVILRPRISSEAIDSQPKMATRNSAPMPELKPKKRKVVDKEKLHNGDESSASNSSNLLNSRPLSSSSNASSAISQTGRRPWVKKMTKRWHFKGSTYSMSIHGKPKKKPRYRYYRKIKSDQEQEQTDADDNSKSSFFDHHFNDSPDRKSNADSEKKMPVLTDNSNFLNNRTSDVRGPPVLEMQIDKQISPVSESKISSSSKLKLSCEMIAPFKIPFAFNGERRKITVISTDQKESDSYYDSLCTCRSVEGYHILSRMRPGTYCEGVDCIDGRLIGCVNVISSVSVFRPSVRAPFQALCELHRHRMRFHQSCPACGLFCTQGSFVQCRADPKKALHHAHKECLLIKDGVECCPHCGVSTELQSVTLELNAPKATSFYQTQQMPFRKEPGARMAFTRGHEYKENIVEEDSSLPFKSCKIADSGKEISTVGLPVGPERSRLEKVIDNLSSDKPVKETASLSSVNMYNAAKSGDVEKVLQMLMLGFDANTKFDASAKQSVLHVAAANGHLMLVHVLLQAGASLNTYDNNLMTPIMLAIENGHPPVAQYLIKAGCQLDTKGEDSMTSLHFAAKFGLMDICRLILETGKININVQDDGGWTPIIWGCEFKHLPVVKFLLDRGADPNSRDKEHNIALHWSAFSGSLEISEILLNRGCDINAKNEHGDSPLHVAARQDNYECVMLFLARNADVDSLNKENETPIMCCEDNNSQTFMALNMSKHLKKISASCPSRSEIIVSYDISKGKEQNPIQCVNGVDNETTPTDFLYIKENCETSPISLDRLITSLQSCQCDHDCSSAACACCSLSIRCWYTKPGRLVDEFNFLDPPMIFECNRACRCWNTCGNRVLQHGITCRLQLFRTKDKGWGVRTLRDIPKGTFLCEYIGEVITDSEADRREDDSYLFDLDNKDGESYCIDARYYGNISRFINHSCEPNLVPVKIFVDYQDLRFPRIALFSARAIKAHEELGVRRKLKH